MVEGQAAWKWKGHMRHIWDDVEDDVVRIALRHGWDPEDVTRQLKRRTPEEITARFELLEMVQNRTDEHRQSTTTVTGRVYKAWTDEEDAIITAALAHGYKQGAVCKLLEGRSVTQVQNRIRTLRRRQTHECVQCCNKLPEHHPYPICDGCREHQGTRSKERYARLRAQGICTTCGTEPADASLTMCAGCLQQSRSYHPKPISRGRNPRQGFIRWIGSPAVGRHVRQFPKRHQVIDLFGGSAAYTLRAHTENHKVLAYNDLHTGLHAFMAALKDGKGREVWDLCQDLAMRPVGELVSIYKRGPTFHREGHAAVTYMLARSSSDKNLRNPKVDEVYEPPTWKTFHALSNRAAKAFEGAEVTNLDFHDALVRFDGPDAFFFCDPPYPQTAKFEHNMTGRHQELIDQLLDLEGKFLLVFHSSRRSAVLMRPMPFVYRVTTRLGPIKVRELVATNYPLSDHDAEPMDWSAFGL